MSINSTVVVDFYDSVSFLLSFPEFLILRFLPAGLNTILGNVAISTLRDVLIQKTPAYLHTQSDNYIMRLILF
jgi:hypothetical protein